MESQLSFFAPGIAPVAAPAAVDIGPAGPASKTGSGTSDFAQVLTGETLRTQRQQLAALGAQDSGLQVVPLGSNMRVITSDAPLPDLESLAQFARQQGLNETAIKALFGPTVKTTMPTVNLGPVLADSPALNREAAVTAPHAIDAVGAFLNPAAKIEIAILATPSAPSAAMAKLETAVSGEAAVTAPHAIDAVGAFLNPAAKIEIAILATPSAPLAAMSKLENPVFSTPGTVVTPHSATPLASAATADLPLSLARFVSPKGHDQPKVSDSAAPEPSGPPAGAALPELPMTLGPANPISFVSESAGTSLKATAAPSASLAGTAKHEPALLTFPSAVWTPQGTVALASTAAAIFAPLGSAPVQPVGIVLAAGEVVGLMPMTADAWVGKASNTDAASAMSADAPVAPPNPSDALRLTLAMPAPEITKRLAQMSGTGKELTWAALLAAGPLAKESATAASDILRLEVPPDYDLALDIASLAGTPPEPDELAAQSGTAPPSTPAQAGASGSTASKASQAPAQSGHRVEQFQQLADQMGQAAAQRLIAQIERGQWKLQMRMQPAALGTIQVELDMHAGGLDASFSADQAITRELMVQGSNRLKETLTDAGMTVASVTVNRDQSRQSGGNSTPGKGRGTAPVVGVSGRSAAIDGLVPKRAEAAPSDGLNVLA